ncbi:FtsH protease activity modulator HflK [Desulfomonile tiedjei]|uniref:Protein HflK n=1 Tax=Desulfomonile tiedjei (strain ATCC 49306 / DSM 6799 / DCB-1) TaxID=706587 RepID=I4CA06_DESTA|nr:FtsH protease activity modulator HflK [Desulfomonile tiedjei]AFM26397.1 protease FtsH subunit HflK [Desulfomonile tiedjei DSM 6799]
MDQFRPREDPNPVRDLQRGVEDFRALMDRFLKGRGLFFFILILFLVYLASGIYIVGPGEKGVVLMFGEVHSITDPGLRYRLPKPFMSHTVVDIAKVRRAEIGFRSDRNRTRTVPVESLMLTGDENIVDVQLFVQYLVQDPVKFLFGADAPENALKTSAEVALRGVVGENTIDHTMTEGRLEIQQKVETYLQRLLDSYNTGLKVTQARLLVVDPPAQVQEAFHDVVRAWEDRERLIKEAEGFREDVIPKARGQAQQTIREAEAYKAQRVIRAKGDAERFTTVLREYVKSPSVTRERLYLETAEQFLPGTKKYIMENGSSRVLPVLPLTPPSAAMMQSSPADQEKSTEKKGN